MNRSILTLGLAVMDLCWLYPWAALLGVWADPGRTTGLVSAPTILLVLMSGAGATYFLGTRLGRTRKAKVVLTALAMAVAVAVVRVEQYSNAAGIDWVAPLLGALAGTIGQLTAPVLAFALALYLWYRGVRLGIQTPSFVEVEGSFRWGIGRLAAFGLAMAISRRIEAETTPYVVAFFFVSLLTLALSRLESLRTRTRRPSLNTQWLAVLIVVAACVVLLALLLGQIVSFDLLTVATRPLFDLLGRVILVLLYIIVIPLSYVIEWLIYLVLSLVSLDANRLPPQPPEPADVDTGLQRFLAEQVSPELLTALKAGAAALLLLLALVIVARTLSRWRPSSADADATNEERDSTLTADRLRAMLLALLRRLLRRRARPALPPADGQGQAETPEAAPQLGSVRALYAHMLRIGEAAGVVRGVATTPLEHVPALAGSLEPQDAITGVTAAYLQVRYAETDLPSAETAELREQLERVRPIGAAD